MTETRRNVAIRDGRPETVHEFRLLRASAPRCYFLNRLRRWRWDSTNYVPAYFGSPHQARRGDWGYTFTRWGALRRIAAAAATAEGEGR